MIFIYTHIFIIIYNIHILYTYILYIHINAYRCIYPPINYQELDIWLMARYGRYKKFGAKPKQKQWLCRISLIHWSMWTTQHLGYKKNNLRLNEDFRYLPKMFQILPILCGSSLNPLVVWRLGEQPESTKASKSVLGQSKHSPKLRVTRGGSRVRLFFLATWKASCDWTCLDQWLSDSQSRNKQ